MSRAKAKDEPSFGFLSTLESPEYGHFGGYLIVSPLGRPLEFHCTSPVRPSRAQEILYGPTLQPYLIGEQISGALLAAAKLTPQLVFTDTAAMLAARSRSQSPMAYVISSTAANVENHVAEVDSRLNGLESNLDGSADASSAEPSRLRYFDGLIELCGYELQLPRGFEAEKDAVAQLATQLSQHVDLAEPFGRIHEAIREAQRIGGRAGESHGQAA